MGFGEVWSRARFESIKIKKKGKGFVGWIFPRSMNDLVMGCMDSRTAGVGVSYQVRYEVPWYHSVLPQFHGCNLSSFCGLSGLYSVRLLCFLLCIFTYLFLWIWTDVIISRQAEFVFSFPFFFLFFSFPQFFTRFFRRRKLVQAF